MNAFDITRPLRVLLLADNKPGHYHQSEGIVRAFERLGPVACRRLQIERRQLVPRALLRTLQRRGARSERILSLGYGLGPADISTPDIVVSSGGDTLFANLAAARISGARNIFLGPVDNNMRDAFNLVISSHDMVDPPANHVRTLQPNAIDPDTLGRPVEPQTFTLQRPPRTAALLVGGNTRDIRYSADDWTRLGAFLRATHKAWGTRWVVSSSRRTSPSAIAALMPVLHDKAVVRQFLDYRLAGPSSLPGVLRLAEVVVVTADSSAMLSEAVAGRFPVISVSAADHCLDDAENRYREYIARKNWSRLLPISLLTTERFLNTLGDIRPRDDNHLDAIAALLRDRFPEMVTGLPG